MYDYRRVALPQIPRAPKAVTAVTEDVKAANIIHW